MSKLLKRKKLTGVTVREESGCEFDDDVMEGDFAERIAYAELEIIGIMLSTRD